MVSLPLLSLSVSPSLPLSILSPSLSLILSPSLSLSLFLSLSLILSVCVQSCCYVQSCMLFLFQYLHHLITGRDLPMNDMTSGDNESVTEDSQTTTPPGNVITDDSDSSLPINDSDSSLPINDSDLSLPINDSDSSLPINDSDSSLPINDSDSSPPTYPSNNKYFPPNYYPGPDYWFPYPVPPGNHDQEHHYAHLPEDYQHPNPGDYHPPISYPHPEYHFPPIPPQQQYPGYSHPGDQYPSNLYPPIPIEYGHGYYPQYQYDPVYGIHPSIQYPQQQPSDDNGYQSHLGDDPHFAVALPSGSFLCYSIQGDHNRVFNLISNRDVHINALFVPDKKQSGVTWIGALGIVSHRKVSGYDNATFISLNASNKSVAVVTRNYVRGKKSCKTVLLKAKQVSGITIINNQLYIRRRVSFMVKPLVNVLLADAKLNFTVKFDGPHLDMHWDNVGTQAPLSHGLIGQFFRPGVELDPVRKMLIMVDKEPIPVAKRPIWSFMDRRKGRKRMTYKHCWMSMNAGIQGDGLIDGHYQNYIVPRLLSTDFSAANIH